MARRENAGRRRWRAVVRRVYVLDVLWRAAANYAEHGGAVYAAAISYYVLFSLFPLLIFAVAALGLLVRDPSIQDRVVSAIINQFPPAVNLRGQVETAVSGVVESSVTVLGLVGLLTAVWTASGAFGALGGAVLFLLFVFLVANIVIIAAEVTAELVKDRDRAAHMPAGRTACARPGG